MAMMTTVVTTAMPLFGSWLCGPEMYLQPWVLPFKALHASALSPFADEQSEASAVFPKDGVLSNLVLYSAALLSCLHSALSNILPVPRSGCSGVR